MAPGEGPFDFALQQRPFRAFDVEGHGLGHDRGPGFLQSVGDLLGGIAMDEQFDPGIEGRSQHAGQAVRSGCVQALVTASVGRHPLIGLPTTSRSPTETSLLRNCDTGTVRLFSNPAAIASATDFVFP